MALYYFTKTLPHGHESAVPSMYSLSLQPPQPTPKRGCKTSFQGSEKLQVLECETEGQGRGAQSWDSESSASQMRSNNKRVLHEGRGLGCSAFTAASLASGRLTVDTRQRLWVAEEVRASSTLGSVRG